MLPKKQPSGAAKRNKRKRDNQFAESQKGALNKFFPSASSGDINNNNQRREPDPKEADDHNSNADLEVNEQSLDDSK